jgi:2-polyprenyl-6-methoxyphenol hydroxylase-like FAD-dependent oxidoreductase
MAPQRILIVGCGIAGPTLATFLLRSSLPILDKPNITILERSSAPRSQGQNVDIRGIGLYIIRKLGLEEEIRASTTGEKGVQWVTKDNKVWASFGAGPDEKIHSPTSDMEIMRGQLADICLKRSERESDEVKGKGGEGIEYIFGDYIQEIEQYQSEVTVRFAKSRERRVFDLVVGADGLQSQLRKMVWGAHAEREHLKRLDMYAAFFSIPRAQTDTMWRRCFHTSGRRVIMVRPSKQSDRTTVLLTVINDRDERLPDAATSGSKDAETQKRLIEDYFANAGWETDRILREMKSSKDFYYDMVAQVKMSDWSKGNVVLLGDAA